MICKFCGTENVEDAIFCSSCGKRIDGNKVCDACGKTISEQSVFCSYCGARVDGKKICATCGTEVEHAFCQQCGTLYGEEKFVQKTDKKEKLAVEQKCNSKYQKVANILSPSLMLSAMVVLFICSFFIGITAQFIGYDLTAGVTTNGPFYFFDDVFKQLALVKDEVGSGAAGMYVATILVTISLAANFIVSTTLLAIASVKYGRCIAKKQSVNLTKYAVWAFATFVFAVFSVLILAQGSVMENGEGIKTVASAGSIAGIVLGAILLFGGIAVSLFEKGKQVWNGKMIAKTILSVVGFILIFAMLAIVAGNCIKYTEESYGVTLTTYSPYGYMEYFLLLLGRSDRYGFIHHQALLTSLTWMFAVFALVSLCLLLVYVIFSLEKGRKKSLLFAIMTTAFSIAYFVMAIVSKGFANNSLSPSIFDADCVSLGGPIAVMILSIVLLGVVIAISVVAKRKKEIAPLMEKETRVCEGGAEQPFNRKRSSEFFINNTTFPQNPV